MTGSMLVVAGDLESVHEHLADGLSLLRGAGMDRVHLTLDAAVPLLCFWLHWLLRRGIDVSADAGYIRIWRRFYFLSTLF